MSVNYYFAKPGTNEPDESRHLGQWAAGRFTARAYPERGVVDRASWEAQLTEGPIVAEHHAPATVEEMREMADVPFPSRYHPRPDETYVDRMRFLSVEFF
jgi:hypothetical protein